MNLKFMNYVSTDAAPFPNPPIAYTTHTSFIFVSIILWLNQQFIIHLFHRKILLFKLNIYLFFYEQWLTNNMTEKMIDGKNKLIA